jgi:hypothetical protein
MHKCPAACGPLPEQAGQGSLLHYPNIYAVCILGDQVQRLKDPKNTNVILCHSTVAESREHGFQLKVTAFNV